MNEGPVNDSEHTVDPFAEWNEAPRASSAAPPMAMALGGAFFGAAVGAGSAYLLHVEPWWGAAAGALPGAIVGWFTKGPSGTA